MNNCDTFVLASRYETFGVVYIEALACGKPVIATKCGGPNSIVNENNGYLVNIDDIEALSNSMKLMFQNIENYDARLIRKECEKKYNPQVIASELEEIYLNLLKGN